MPLTGPAVVWFRDHYFRGAADYTDWRASPLLAASQAGLPPATIVTAELDHIYDEGRAYADKLRSAGVR